MVNDKLKKQALRMYLAGYTNKDIADELEINLNTIKSWEKRTWSILPKNTVSIEVRLSQLVLKNNKDEKDLKEIEILQKAKEKEAKLTRYQLNGKPSTLNSKLKNPAKAREKKKNYFNPEQIKKLKKIFNDSLYPHQKLWARSKENRNRIIIKARQIGATYYFSGETLIDALESEKNKIFISASRNQANIFRENIVDLALRVGVKLVGSSIKLFNGATLYFLGTNARTAQGYTGDVFIDEAFWINKFTTLKKLAGGIATHTKYRRVYLSTASFVGHEAYKMLKGKEGMNLEISHENLKNGLKCDDSTWRCITTIDDAIAGGFDKIDIEEIRNESSNDEYKNLYMCEFMDDSSSAFSLKHLNNCAINPSQRWNDFKPFNSRPLGNKPVWVGYDPSGSVDPCALVVVAPPYGNNKKYRVLECLRWKKLSFSKQAEKIKEITNRYNVEYLAIDSTGLGYGVYELVKKFYNGARKINYTSEIKNKMVVKTQRLFEEKQIEFDFNAKSLISSFISIKRTQSLSGGRICYVSSRHDDTGHSDIAWAMMNVIEKTELLSLDYKDVNVKKKPSIIII